MTSLRQNLYFCALLLSILKCLEIQTRFIEIIMLIGYVIVVVVVFVLHGPSTLFMSFRARPVNLSTLFLGKPPRQFTST